MLKPMLLAVLLLAVWLPDAHAVHDVNSCPVQCTGGEQCNLVQDITCNTNPAITLVGGADLDLKGYTITCSGCSSSAAAVLITGSSSTVEDTGKSDGTRGGILGAWGKAIDCAGKTNSIVRNLKVDGSTTGLSECRKVTSVTVANTATTGISNTSIGGTDYIKDSYIVNTATGILLGGSGAGTIDHNVIANVSSYAIDSTNTTSSSLAISSNTLFTEGAGTLIGTGGTAPTTTANVCGSSGVSVCGTCISAGKCTGAVTPFVGP